MCAMNNKFTILKYLTTKCKSCNTSRIQLAKTMLKESRTVDYAYPPMNCCAKWDNKFMYDPYSTSYLGNPMCMLNDDLIGRNDPLHWHTSIGEQERRDWTLDIIHDLDEFSNE